MKLKLHLTILLLVSASIHSQINSFSWSFYRPGNTGIQGDMATALWLDNDGNPYIAANTGNWGEGGFAKFDQSLNKWINYSNVDLPVLGGFDNGDINITDFVKDQNGTVWMSKFTGALKFNPSVGSSSIVSYDDINSPFTGITYDLDLAPDGSVWFSNEQTVKYNPTDNSWTTYAGSDQLLSVQPKADGSYVVWLASSYYGNVMQINSATGITTNYTPTNIGDVAGLPGKDCTDDYGNFWALRMLENGDFETLEYQKQDGTWVHPTLPYSNFTFYIDAFKAFGNEQAVMVLVNGEVWRFDGTSWLNYGIWRQGDNNTSIDIDASGNVWVCGIEGAAKRDVLTGNWQRYRLTNTSQIDYFVEDITIDNDGSVWMTGNAGTGVGGIQKFDGSSWTGFNPYTYDLGNDFPFMADNTTAITCRQSTNDITFSPTFHGVHTWNGANFTSQESELVTSKGLVEDSQGKLWSLGEYFNYRLYNDQTNTWTDLPIVGWGSKIIKDPTLPGTIWVETDNEIQRNDGTNVLSLDAQDFPNFQGQFTGIAVEPSGILWTGTWMPNQVTGSSLIKYDTNTADITTWTYDAGWPFPGEHVRPIAYTPDGMVWMQYDAEYPSTESGILAFDGVNVYDFPSSPGGLPNWNMLPNSTIKDAEVKPFAGGYELWLSCLGRGIAVLKVNSTTLNNNQPIIIENKSLMVYPNPAEDIVTVYTDTIGENYTIVDMLGKIIDSGSLNSPNTIISVAHLQKGMYFIQSGTKVVKLIKK